VGGIDAAILVRVLMATSGVLAEGGDVAGTERLSYPLNGEHGTATDDNPAL
jgi:hypothetical protein